MKKWFAKLLPYLLLIIVLIASVIIGAVYSNFISKSIYEDSTKHLKEVYGQVNRSFGAFVERNRGLLTDWKRYFELCEYDEATIQKYIDNEKKYWGFSDFYFIAPDKTAMNPTGLTTSMTLENKWDSSTARTHFITGEKLFGTDVTIFVLPTEEQTYKGYTFNGIAMSYTNKEIADSLNADAFTGEAQSFVLHRDGRVLLSMQEGGIVFSNYLTYLNESSDMSDETFAKLHSDFAQNKSDVILCNIGGEPHSIYYQPVGYQDYFLLSAVPQSAVSAGFLTVQKTTTNVLGIIFVLVGVGLVAMFILLGIVQSRKNKTELQYREFMFDVLSGTVDDIFIMLDPASQSVDYISPNLERLLGISKEEAKKDIRVLQKCAINFNVIIPEHVLSTIPDGGNKNWECEYMHQKTGEHRWYRTTIYHMSIRSIKKFIVVMSDRTLEQQMNKQLQEALNAAKSANEAKSNFLSNMSHDIRTPMNAIVGFSVLLEKDAGDSDKVREYTHKIMASSHHLLSLINDVLDMSKIESGKTSLNIDKFSLPELLEELNIIITPQAKAKKQEFTIHVNGAPPEKMLGDKLRLNQILINLLSNAVKYTPDQGKIDFIVGELPQPAQGYVKLKFVVKDNGIGMSEDFVGEVFNPFSREINSVTNKIQGTGLGMAITKNLVDLMGGIITVESELGKGSTFTVEMSFSLPETEESESWFRQKVARMLVCDDEEDICLNIREMMRDTGIDVACVYDGISAVEWTERAHSDGEDFNVILLDWKMPGMDGVETARRIREKVGSYVPILVLTSYDWSEIEVQARNAGINAFMPKPFFTSTFLQTIKPLFVDEKTEQNSDDDKYKNVLKGRLFLVAEDNELNAEILTEMLAMEGAKCELATNGKEAVDMFLAAEPDKYDTILMDVQMPVMNGYEATRAIRALDHPRAKVIPIVAMTANTFAEDVRNALDAGMDGHLAKPIDMKKVKETIVKLLGDNK